jgi:hypothetical protein
LAIAWAATAGLAGAAHASGPVDLSLEFQPRVASVGQPVTIALSSTNQGESRVSAKITLSLEVGGTSSSVSQEFWLEGGEGTCARYTVFPSLPGVIRITARAALSETVSLDSDTLYVLPGGSGSPFEDLPALGQSILASFRACVPTPVEPTSWGRIKTRYR